MTLTLLSSDERYGNSRNMRLNTGSLVYIRYSTSVLIWSLKCGGGWSIIMSVFTSSGNDEDVISWYQNLNYQTTEEYIAWLLIYQQKMVKEF